MPRDLFGAVASRPRAVRSRRAPIVSFLVHTLALAGAVVLSLVESDALPRPREMLAYYAPAPVMDVKLPPPPPQRPNPTHDQTIPAVRSDAAPVVAPDGTAPETPVEDLVTAERTFGVVSGFGDPSGIMTGAGRQEEPPPQPPAVPVRLHSGIRAPLKTTHVAPVYPAIAMAARVQGFVIVEATIDTQGNVAAVTVLKSIPTLDAAALEAVRQWKFTPAMLNGAAVPVIMTVTVRFTLQ